MSSLSFLDRQGTGDLVGSLTTDVGTTEQWFIHGLQSVLCWSSYDFSVTIASMARLDWMMMGMVLILAHPYHSLSPLCAKRSSSLQDADPGAWGSDADD